MALARKLVVHIGQPKTGTTTLQATLARSRQSLLQHGILYPAAGKAMNHTPASYYLTDRTFMPVLKRRQFDGDGDALFDKSRKAWQSITAQITQTRPDTVILSSETIQDFGWRGAVPTFLDKIAPIAEHITVVCYLREPASLYLSLKQQNLKHGRIDPAPLRNKRMQSALEPFLKDHRVDLKVHEFSRDELVDGDVVADFADRYLPASARARLTRVPGDLNTSLSAEMMLVCEDLLAGTENPKLERHAGFPMSLSAALPVIDRSTQGFHPARLRYGIANLIQSQSDDLQWMQDTFGIGFDAPNDDIIDPAINPADLVSTRDLCDFDEDRYKRLLESFPSPETIRGRAKGRTITRWIGNTPARMKRNTLSLLNRIARTRG